ncbi:hypothetical protein CVU82_01180 [Candidatus Falkowbacteria bacterium HGW-Falkowbacteria-1]|jgi:predicted small integral membrane protein|uniref:Uncharacterized protein n=1 Tax=Candidatus Falkowbacteria bacterium HGW-Falkowbacteria-1 TaxID=2013768 RepID=A0A2N2EAN8_9BACT|nr:MAG: hypothetical protein CVU82_01180 [Candidatus Falkowbacteria bacterium HGW-Falkowbacteria-1]
MNWSVFYLVALLNTLFCLSQYLAEQLDKKRGNLPSRKSIISSSKQKFLYWEDFYTQTYGDLFGLVWITNGFIHLAIKGEITNLEWVIFIAFSIILATIFAWMNLRPSHKPDWGYPQKGKISLGGISHLPYFGILSGMALICFINIISGDLRGAPLWATLAGGLFYIIMTVADIKSGNFDEFKTV